MLLERGGKGLEMDREFFFEMYSDSLDLEVGIRIHEDALDKWWTSDTIGEFPYTKRTYGVETSVVFQPEHLLAVEICVGERDWVLDLLPAIKQYEELFNEVCKEVKECFRACDHERFQIVQDYIADHKE